MSQKEASGKAPTGILGQMGRRAACVAAGKSFALEQNDPLPGFGQEICRAQAGQAAPHDDDVAFRIAFDFGEFRQSGRLPGSFRMAHGQGPRLIGDEAKYPNCDAAKLMPFFCDHIAGNALPPRALAS